MFTVIDSMGVPRLYNTNMPIGNNVTGYAPLPSNLQTLHGDVTDNTSVNQIANGLLELANAHNTLLVNNQLVASGTGDSVAAQNPTHIVARPWLEAPEGAVPFDPQTAAALTGVGTQVEVVRLVVPDGYDGVINAFSWNFTGGGFVQGDGSLQAQILRNGAAVRNYDNILVEKGTIAIPRPISPLRIYSGQVITLVVNHLANGLLAGNLIGCFSGYFYPSAS